MPAWVGPFSVAFASVVAETEVHAVPHVLRWGHALLVGGFLDARPQARGEPESRLVGRQGAAILHPRGSRQQRRPHRRLIGCLWRLRGECCALSTLWLKERKHGADASLEHRSTEPLARPPANHGRRHAWGQQRADEHGISSRTAGRTALGSLASTPASGLRCCVATGMRVGLPGEFL
jgi:hypothetical protein